MIKILKTILIFFWETFRTTKNTFQSLRQWWDFGKVQMKQFCQQHTRNITVQLSKSMKNLEASIVKLQELAESAGGRDVLEALTMKKTQLGDLLGVKVQGALVRSRFQNIDQMDAPTIFFLIWKKRMDRKD